MVVFTFDSVDRFVADGITEAAESIGVEVDPRVRDGSLRELIGEGSAGAYLIAVTANSFRCFPSNKIVDFASQRRLKQDMLWIMDWTPQEFDEYDGYQDTEHPLVQEVADFLMLSMTMYQKLLGRLKENYNLGEIEEKAREYYDDASQEVEGGEAVALAKLAEDFERYLVTLRRFSREKLLQSVDGDYEQREHRIIIESKRRKFNSVLDLYMKCRQMKADKEEDWKVQSALNEFNEKAEKYNRLNPRHQVPLKSMDDL